MQWNPWGLVCAFVSLALAAAPCRAQDEKTTTTTTTPGGTTVTTEKSTGGRINSAVEGIKKGAVGAGEAVKSSYSRARESVHNMNTSSRIYSRLHWDKALNGTKIDISVKQDGVATLSGSVANALARAKAVELTRDTVGVSQVVDQLSIGPADASGGTTIIREEKITTPRGRTTVKEKTVTP